MTRNLSIAIFIGGLLVAICGAAKLPPEGATWPDTWPVFTAGTIVCLVGLIGWRQSTRHGKGGRQTHSESCALVFETVRLLEQELTAMLGHLEELDENELRGVVDRFDMEYFEPIVDNRHAVLQHYGMKDGAEILLRIAYAQRYFHRAWSAAADRHKPEAHASFRRAGEALTELHQWLTQKFGTDIPELPERQL